MTYQQDQHPVSNIHDRPYRDIVRERNDIEHQEDTNERLVEQQLHAGAIQQLMIPSNEHGIQRAGEHARKRENGANRGGPSLLPISSRLGIVVAHHRNTHTNREQREGGFHRYRSPDKHVIQQGDNGRQQDAHDLVELDAGENERGVGKDDVEDHGQREREDLCGTDALVLEQGDGGPGDGVKE